MIFTKEKALKDEIIRTGKKLYALRLVAARAGNLSARIDEGNILITATGTSLGELVYDDIIKVDLSRQEENKNNRRLTSEFAMHSAIYKSLPHKIIIHCHPSLVNAYFAVSADLKVLTFETKLYLGEVPVVEQDTPAVSKPESVVAALKNNNLAVIKNHGVVAIAENFSEALYLIETLEEAVKVCATARLFKKDILDELDKGLKENFAQSRVAYLMFSREHIQAIVELVNKDELIAKKGAELDLTTQVVIKMDGHKNVYKFNFEKGKIARLDTDEDAPFVISAPLEAWEAIFLGKLNPFVATTQGKMKLKGDFGKLSRWYVPFNRLFEIFKQVRIK
ncbi:MAG: class II aldolase/adducin family protein [Candidatus Omnitrophota bacterium]|nr:class II aldolase/adducin family protein [Candidatus Omnitrophota bacterium]